jgi:hypothetical protein
MAQATQKPIDAGDEAAKRQQAQERVTEERQERRTANPVNDQYVVVSPIDLKAQQIAEAREESMRNPLDLVTEGRYVVGGEIVDADGNPVESDEGDAKTLLEEAEKNVERLRERAREQERLEIERGAFPSDRVSTEETSNAAAARGGARPI